MMTPQVIFLIVAIAAAIACVGIAVGAHTRASIAQRRLRGAEEVAESEREAREALAIEKAAADAMAARIPELEQTIRALRDRCDAAHEQLAETRTTLDGERKNHAARIGELQKMGVEIEQRFAVLASEALGKNSERFLKLVSERFDKHKQHADQDLSERRKAIETLVKPIGDSLAKFEKAVGNLEKEREGAYRAIKQQVKSLAEGQTGLQSETRRLVQALRQPKTRGRWGEYQLRNVLEMAGMSEHVDFVEQAHADSEDGALRPDVIVHLPGNKSVIVDAKTPLDGYLDAHEANDEEAKRRHMNRHVRQVRNHVNALGSKKYWQALPGTPDFVVMFIPGEAFFSAAIESEPGLFEQAVRNRVLISTPTTFIALVKAIAYGWQQENLAENSRKVANLAHDLFERIKTFSRHMEALGRSLQTSVKRYNDSLGSLERRVLPAARKFEAMGVTPAGSTIPELQPVEIEAREPQAAELLAASSSRNPEPDDA